MRTPSLLLIAPLFATLVAADGPPPPADRAEDVRPVVVGSRLGETPVTTADGEEAGLTVAIGGGKKILIVYRGGWCPVCTRHFQALGTKQTELEEAGWEMVALSPDTPESIAAWIAEHEDDGIERLSDSPATAIRELGLAFVVDEATREKYRGYGIDLAKASGHDHHILPVPAVMLIVNGEIRFLHADADYRRRLDPDLLMAAIASVDEAGE